MAEVSPFNRFMTDLFPAYGEWLKKQTPKQQALYVVRHHVYVLQLSGTSFFKIGYSTDPEKRMRDLQISSPVPLECFGIWIVPSRKVEGQLHRQLKHLWKSGEWFELSEEAIQNLLNSMKDYKRVK